ncbi:ROK family transcriptional regulator [Tropicibacter sp. R16_0]|uniref:ROK family transcriptional regulator n=1 Tax=Tropicibacter sp. R16_0 TaxID=2821102 RepID=UPI0025707043|nr:ROK family transcriptional regulator [Tropicibacter sp. R16_0]
MSEIRKAGRIPRIELSERTGISRATVTTITAELLQHGLIEEVAREDGSTDSRRGRPRVDLKIRGAARLVAGVKISHLKLSLVLLDFEGQQLECIERDLDQSVHAPDALAIRITQAVRELAETAGHTMEDVSGVGIGIAGVVDAENGFVYWSPSLDTRNVEFSQLASQHLGLPAFVDNDANLVAFAEYSFGLARGVPDFLVVTIESGVGLGLMIDGELYRGTRGCGAEFGHTKVHLNGALCRCGQRGCLEAYVADYALLREATLTSDADTSADPSHRIEALLNAARNGDPTARSVVDRAGQYFAMGLANLANIFDPALIILAGEQMQFDHLYEDAVIEAMRKSIIRVDRDPPEVVVHKWGDLMWAKGGAAYALDRVSDLALDEMSDNAA